MPAYVYPSNNSNWADLAVAAAQVKTHVIFNPGNGPGSKADTVIDAAVQKVRQAGGKVYGYVSSQYGGRAIASAKADVDAYLGFYQVDGFFVDEMAISSAQLAYYQQLYAYIKTKGLYRVIGNPGTGSLEAYLAQGAADVLVTYEHSYASYQANSAPLPWTSAYPASRFAHIVYGVSTASAMQAVVAGLAQKHVGLVYVTDDAGSNPFDTLPTYWQSELTMLRP